ncbi:MAG: DUF6804 family protein [Melioribacteraceae bacterium]
MKNILKKFSSYRNKTKYTLIAVLALGGYFYLPASYLQFIQIVAMLGFLYLYRHDKRCKRKLTPQVFAVAAIIVNPVINFQFKKETWEMISLGLIAVILLSFSQELFYWNRREEY